MGAFSDMQQEQRRQRTQLADAQRAAGDAANSDQVFDGTRRLMLRAPGGTYFALTVGDDGTLHTTNMGANPL